MAHVRKKICLFTTFLFLQFQLVLPSVLTDESPNAVDNESYIDATNEGGANATEMDVDLNGSTSSNRTEVAVNELSDFGIQGNNTDYLNPLNASTPWNNSLDIIGYGLEIQPRGIVKLRSETSDPVFLPSSPANASMTPFGAIPSGGQNSPLYNESNVISNMLRNFSMPIVPYSNAVPYSKAVPYAIFSPSSQTDNSSVTVRIVPRSMTYAAINIRPTTPFTFLPAANSSGPLDVITNFRPYSLPSPSTGIIPRSPRLPTPPTTMKPIQGTTKRKPSFRSVGSTRRPRTRSTKGMFRSVTKTATRIIRKRVAAEARTITRTSQKPKTQLRKVMRKQLKTRTTKSRFRNAGLPPYVNVGNNPNIPDIVELQQILNILTSL
ncbi:uncharacterized protein LOC115257134 [Aedes albopictus]|uniref:Uncharacterized protein n=1 Tax=Aedes albopictus TaxID=7160 RepID=A0ABM1ZL37_AEDAL